MMRMLFFALLIANIGFAIFVLVGDARRTDRTFLYKMPNIEKIRILPQIADGAGAHKTTAQSSLTDNLTSDLCVEWGTFAGNEIERAAKALDNLIIADRPTQRTIEESTAYWVYIPPVKTKSEADNKVLELDALGITEHYVIMDGGKWRNAISLGIFKTEEAARNFLARLREKGVKSAVAGKRAQLVKQTAFIIKHPDDVVLSKLVEIRLQFPGSELKPVNCG